MTKRPRLERETLCSGSVSAGEFSRSLVQQLRRWIRLVARRLAVREHQAEQGGVRQRKADIGAAGLDKAGGSSTGRLVRRALGRA